MNKSCFRLIFSKQRNALVAVGETAAAQGKAASGAGTRATVAMLATTALLAGAAHAQLASNALPSGATLSSGAASVSSSGANMNINQTSNRASLNWNSFNVGSAASVTIAQPNAGAVLLNRVIGSDPSQILGKINANGQVMLVNPNGIVFGKGGSVSAAAFTASTMGITDADFQAGNYTFSRNGSTAGIVNEGTITTAQGGYVALIGVSVVNDGKIVSNGGDVSLVAGESATVAQDIGIPVSRGGKVRLMVTAANINTAVSNTGNGVIQTSGGQVLMQASSVGPALASIRQLGAIDTSGAQGGAVRLRADKGNITVRGGITANSTTPNTAGADIIIGQAIDSSGRTVLAASTDVAGAALESRGGLVETSGEALAFNGVRVKAKDWLLDPFNVDIDAAAAATISAALATTNVTIETTSGGSTGANSPGDGNITVNSAITKTGSEDHTLTMTAANGIDINAAIGVAGGSTGKLNVALTANGGAAVATDSKGLTVTSAISSNGGAISLTGTNLNTSGLAGASGVLVNGAVNAGASGSITVRGTSASYNGVEVRNDLTALGGDISINGTSNASTGTGQEASVFVFNSTLRAQNISATGTATNTNAGSRVLGYRGGNETFVASNKIDITGSTTNLASGSYGFNSNYSAVNGINISGTSARGKGVGFDNISTVTNSGTGGITITGTSGDASKSAIGLQGINITNNSTDGSATRLIANGGNVTASTADSWGTGLQTNTITNASTAGSIQVLAGNNSATSSSKIDGTALGITQNSNAGVTLLTSGTGDLTVGNLTNNGSGALVLAAGSQVAAGGSGAGGNVVLASGAFTRSNNGTLKINTGSYDTFGAISAFNSLTKTTSGFNTLYYNSPSSANNVGFNKGYTDALTNGDTNNQVVFRQDKAPAFTLALTSTSATYGAQAYPTGQATESARLKAANSGIAGTTPTLTAVEGSNTFTLATADVVANLIANRTLGTRSAGGYEYANAAGYAYNATAMASNGLNLNTTFTSTSGGALTHTITKANASVAAVDSATFYNGATQTQPTTKNGVKAGDLVNVSGAASGRDVGTYRSALAVSGADAANYAVAVTNAALRIYPAQPIVTPVVPVQPANARINLAVRPAGSNFRLSGVEGPDECSSANLEKCSCEELTDLSRQGLLADTNRQVNALICTPTKVHNNDKVRTRQLPASPAANPAI